ncbi:MAG: hypothetical protein QMD21_07140 [Candidatus Thermoplasmatota archaeon]|nr:hypothetical protein [Candidatus Thermoplasmatota archaeon]MDI6887885.1 hypothetical protein [Candidatus Thermoplasmatota archaeon]
MFRKKVKEIRERERVRDAIRARKFSGPETFEQGLSMIKFAAKLWEAEK